MWLRPINLHIPRSPIPPAPIILLLTHSRKSRLGEARRKGSGGATVEVEDEDEWYEYRDGERNGKGR
jgi:hypothetical protein